MAWYITAISLWMAGKLVSCSQSYGIGILILRGRWQRGIYTSGCDQYCLLCHLVKQVKETFLIGVFAEVETPVAQYMIKIAGNCDTMLGDSNNT